MLSIHWEGGSGTNPNFGINPNCNEKSTNWEQTGMKVIKFVSIGVKIH